MEGVSVGADDHLERRFPPIAPDNVSLVPRHSRHSLFRPLGPLAMQSVSHLGAERYSLIASKRIVSVDHTSSNSLAGSMAKKTAKASASAAGPIDTNATGLASDGPSAKDLDANVRQIAGGSLATDPLPTVRVNKANLGEIKSALDDIVKKVRLDLPMSPTACSWRGGSFQAHG